MLILRKLGLNPQEKKLDTSIILVMCYIQIILQILQDSFGETEGH